MSTVVERITDLGYRAMERFRHPDAFELAEQPGTAADFAALAGARQCLIVSFKRSGEAVPTPVNFGLAGDRLYFRSEPRSGKVRRIGRDPHVRVGPCNLRARPSGPMTEARGRVLTGAEAGEAERAVAANWSGPMTVLERGLDRMPAEMIYVEVTPAAAVAQRAPGEEVA